MFMLHGRLAAQPGKRDELLTILSENEQDERLPGCRLYLVAVDQTDAEGVWVTEVWESETAHASSLELTGSRARSAEPCRSSTSRDSSASSSMRGRAFRAEERVVIFGRLETLAP